MRFSDDTTEVRHWTPPEAILAVLRVLHKKTLPPPLIWDLRWGLVDFCLKKLYSVRRSLLVVCHLPDLHAPFLTDMRLVPHAEIFHLTVKTRHKLRSNNGARRCPPPQIKRLSRKFDWDFARPLNWAERAGAWLSANTASNGELESRGSIDLPVTFTRLA